MAVQFGGFMEDPKTVAWILRSPFTEAEAGHFREYWGDEDNWSGLLSYAWRNVNDPYQSLSLPTVVLRGESKMFPHSCQIWTAAVHLLLCGLGWNDLCAGLRKWREEGYRLGAHPILDFLWRTFEEQVEALEIYFGLEPRYQIFEALPASQVRGEVDLSVLEERGRAYEETLGRWVHPNARNRLGHELLMGGTDPLHLQYHVAASIGPADLPAHYEPRITRIGDTICYMLRHCQYAGWLHLLYDVTPLQSLDDRGNGEHTEVLVYIQRLGLLGTWQFDDVSGRWWMAADPQDYEGDFDLYPHRWGVILPSAAQETPEGRYLNPDAVRGSGPTLTWAELPSNLQQLVRDMVSRVHAKFGEEDSEVSTRILRRFMAGETTLTQGELSTRMALLVRMLT